MAQLKPTKYGLGVLSAILQHYDPAQERALLANLATQAPEVAVAVRQRLITFSDLAYADNRGVQLLLKSVPARDLALAMKAAEPTVVEKFALNMSRRALEQLRSDIAALGPRPAREVHAAQDTVLKLMRAMIAQGQLFIERSAPDHRMVD